MLVILNKHYSLLLANSIEVWLLLYKKCIANNNTLYIICIMMAFSQKPVINTNIISNTEGKAFLQNLFVFHVYVIVFIKIMIYICI